jgi:sterol desaturase/sphingolipid hydroxylase (fatty acid hydroxylase superfamily)
MSRVIPAGRLLTRILLVFWASWFSIVFSSNATDALREAGLLPSGFRFHSGNFALVADSVGVYSVPRAGAAILFSLVLVLQLSAAVLFWRASLEREPLAGQAQSSILQPFVVGIALFAGFVLVDEVLLLYHRMPSLETAHLVVLCALLLSLLVIRFVGSHEHHPGVE